MTDHERQGGDRVGTAGVRWLYRVGFALVLVAQVAVSFQGLEDYWVRGHNGFNGAAFHLSARNTLRWGTLFPVQYHSGLARPTVSDSYTHHPLGMHLCNVASLVIFGDRESSIRLVAALHAVAAVLALMLVVRRFWGPGPSVLAGAVYVVLPINAIYANMANHSSGFILWSLVTLYGYVSYREVVDLHRQDRKRASRWYAFVMVSFLLAASWDWPAYYLAFAVAVHWFVVALRRHRRQVWTLRRPDRDLFFLAGFCALVLVMFLGHFLLVRALVGSYGEIQGTFFQRQRMEWPYFSHHLKVVPALMFTVPVLVLCAGWLAALPVRMGRGAARNRDLIPLVYAFAGVLHYVVFRWSAFAHCYWGWTLMPFVAIASSLAVWWIGRQLCRGVERAASGRLGARWARRAGILAGLCASLLLVPLVARSMWLVPLAKTVGGSMWYVVPTRSPQTETYPSSGRTEIRFARMLRQRTTRSTGVLMHVGMKTLAPECRFVTTLDREMVDVGNIPRTMPQKEGVTQGWVFVGAVKDFSPRQRAYAAARYPYLQYEHLFMVDLRIRRRDIQIWVDRPREMDAYWWYMVNPFEPPVQAVRLTDMEAAMEAHVDRMHGVGRILR